MPGSSEPRLNVNTEKTKIKKEVCRSGEKNYDNKGELPLQKNGDNNGGVYDFGKNKGGSCLS